jgi:hypothetical protein
VKVIELTFNLFYKQHNYFAVNERNCFVLILLVLAGWRQSLLRINYNNVSKRAINLIHN